MTDPDPGDRDYSTYEVARLFRVNPQTVRKWAKTGRLEVTETPHGLRFSAPYIRRLLGEPE